VDAAPFSAEAANMAELEGFGAFQTLDFS